MDRYYTHGRLRYNTLDVIDKALANSTGTSGWSELAVADYLCP